MSDDLVARLRADSYALPSCGDWIERNGDTLPNNSLSQAADLIEQQAARIKAMERDVERYRSLIDATEINADSFYWSRNEKAKSTTIVAEMNAIFGMTEE